MERKKRLQRPALFLLIVLHIVGAIGMAWEETRSIFQLLTPLNLCISLGVLGYFHSEWNARFIYWAAFIFLAGYFVEVAGVKTGIIFGTYDYGATLGPKLWEVPPMMGVNWLILIYCTGIISKFFSSNLYLNATLGATLMVLIDLMMEPVAMALDFWDWEAARIPIRNYLAWAGISWVMLVSFHRLEGAKQNPIAFPLYLIQLLFFSALHLLL